ncbi:related to quinate transport protein [Fusarium fujikuroi IMI 58289]|uniref:Related to quinate transport protein n=1 Tax=Gibberella fujikuroi (strain CBS 195.34 / IMI 58289 / NRRL A-6831) TaxID=1279085 RepID=S0EK60_GIBF5|nr:related to quinate transport protein [Fusarium fujikuroi IMI 58289]CCT75169.1 related to quinate transport protein [Fusarium fujikuroi IMI 58289]
MHPARYFSDSSLGKHIRSIRNSPREVIYNSQLLVSSALYAMSGLCITWDQGSSSVVPSLPGFSKAFGITSAANPSEVANFISFVYLTAGVGSALSFFINDRIGRLWSLRLYFAIWIIGQLIATFSYGNKGALYTARFVSGLGIGPLTVTGPMSIVEIAPTEIRGLLTVWFSVVMLLSLTISTLTVYACFLHLPASHLQYQFVWFLPTIICGIIIAASFFACESPRWLMLVGRKEEAIETLVALRGLPADHPRVAGEIADIEQQIQAEKSRYASGGGVRDILRETFMVPGNLRRVQQSLISYLLAQLSGANSVTSYLVPILSLMGINSAHGNNLFLSSMYSLSKFFYTLIASFFFIDALGRRKSLFIGITIQLISDVYLGAYIKSHQDGSVAPGASTAAIAAIFIHGFGYAVGLLVLPYVFGAELWPNSIRSFGSALSQTFHWLFYFGINRATPSILSSMHNWGAFIFFAGWCLVAVIYVFFAVPETAGLPLEHIDALFECPWWQIRSKAKTLHVTTISGSVVDEENSPESLDSKYDKIATTSKQTDS